MSQKIIILPSKHKCVFKGNVVINENIVRYADGTQVFLDNEWNKTNLYKWGQRKIGNKS